MLPSVVFWPHYNTLSTKNKHYYGHKLDCFCLILFVSLLICKIIHSSHIINIFNMLLAHFPVHFSFLDFAVLS